LNGVLLVVAVSYCVSPTSHDASVRETVAIACPDTSRIYRYQLDAPASETKEAPPQKAKNTPVTRKAGKRKTNQRKYRRKRA